MGPLPRFPCWDEFMLFSWTLLGSSPRRVWPQPFTFEVVLTKSGFFSCDFERDFARSAVAAPATGGSREALSENPEFSDSQILQIQIRL